MTRAAKRAERAAVDAGSGTHDADGAPDAPFYRAGLRFECQPSCGACCAQPGKVYVTRDEVKALAAHRGLGIAEFRRRFVRRERGALLLADRPEGGCVFLGPDLRCGVYPARPTQCRTYPFWPEIIADAATWEWEGLKCPGIGKGDVILADEIEVRSRETSSERV